MATSNIGLNNTLPTLLEGQEQKEAAINATTTQINNNFDLLDGYIPTFLGQLSSQPTSGTAPLGSRYYNITEEQFYTLVSKAPDVWKLG